MSPGNPSPLSRFILRLILDVMPAGKVVDLINFAVNDKGSNNFTCAHLDLEEVADHLADMLTPEVFEGPDTETVHLIERGLDTPELHALRDVLMGCYQHGRTPRVVLINPALYPHFTRLTNMMMDRETERRLISVGVMGYIGPTENGSAFVLIQNRQIPVDPGFIVL